MDSLAWAAAPGLGVNLLNLLSAMVTHKMTMITMASVARLSGTNRQYGRRYVVDHEEKEEANHTMSLTRVTDKGCHWRQLLM